MTLSPRAGFGLWLLLIAFILALGGRILMQGVQVSANLMTLFPIAEQSPLLDQASRQMALSQQRRVTFLLGHDDANALASLAPKLVSYLTESQVLKEDNRLAQQSAMAELYQNYRFQLLSPQRRQQLQDDATAVLQQGLVQLFNPFSGVSLQEFLADPSLGLRDFQLAQTRAAQLSFEDGHLWAPRQRGRWLLLPMLLTGDPYDFEIQDTLLATVADLQQQWPELELAYTGAAFYAAYGADSARKEISTIGVGSLIGVLLLILLVFRSIQPLLLALTAIATGVISAAVITHLVFGSVHLFTLVFGACLIGVAIDYAFHFFAHQYQGIKQWSGLQGRAEIFPGISLGLVSSVTAYIALSLAPFPGLRQVALFSSSGLLAAYLTVLLVFPFLAREPGPQAHQVPWAQLKLVELWCRYPIKRRLISCGLVLLLLAPLGSLLETDDDVRSFQGLSPKLRQMESQLEQIMGLTTSPRYFLIEAATTEQLLQKEEALSHAMALDYPDSQLYGMSQFVPSKQQQTSDYQLYTQQVLPLLQETLMQAGFSVAEAADVKRRLAHQTMEPLTVSNWLKSPASEPWRFLVLPQAEGVASMVLLQSSAESSSLAALAQSQQVLLIDTASAYSELFGRYREQIGYLLLIAYGLIFLLLKLRYCWSSALAIVMVPAGATIVTLGGFAVFGVALNLFHILALLLVTGISIDYSIFFAESRTQPGLTLLAVALASATTLLSFGLLALSATPAVQAVGLTVSIGISSAYLLGPLTFRPR